MPKFTYVAGDDWVAFYKDGELLYEGHSLPAEFLLDMLEIDVQIIHNFNFEDVDAATLGSILRGIQQIEQGEYIVRRKDDKDSGGG